MVGPVRPVDWFVPSVPRAVYALCRHLGWVGRGCRAIWLPWIRLPSAPTLGRNLTGAVPEPITRDCRAPACREPPSVEPWQPWPAHPPFADEVTRWWPSDDWPPSEPPVVIEDQIPDVPAEIIDWRARSGLLDLWA